MIRSLRKRFDTLLWRLTGIYVAVSVAICGVLLVSLTILILYVINAFPTYYSEGAASYAAQLGPAFQKSDCNAECLLARLYVAHHTLSNQPNDETFVTISSFPPFEHTLIVLIDAEGRVITGTQPRATTADSVPPDFDQTDTQNMILQTLYGATEPLSYTTGTLLADWEPPEAETVLNRALSGVTDANLLTGQTESGEQALGAAPVIGTNGQVLGVVYARNLMPTTTSDDWIELVVFSLIVIALSAIWGGASGLLYASIVGRGLSRRLKHLADTSAALAGGDLSRRVVEQSADEIGQLGRQFNAMADQLANNVQELRHLADQNAQLAVEARQLATAEERNRLARELHDSVKQQVFAASMNLGAAQELWPHNAPAAIALTQAAATSVEKAKRDLIAIIPALRPPELERDGLAQAMYDYLRLWERQTGITTTRQIDLGTTILPPHMEQALFRILQEALTNIARHSQATNVRCVLLTRPTHIELRISDNGVGFDIRHIREGIGLQSMRERARSIGGTLVIHSNAIGAKIQVVVELDSSSGAGPRENGHD